MNRLAVPRVVPAVVLVAGIACGTDSPALGKAETSVSALVIGKGDPFRPLGKRHKTLRRGQAYSITMAEEALPEVQLPRMVAGHPRLLIRPTPWESGLSLEEVRARAKEEPWAGMVQRQRRDLKKGLERLATRPQYGPEWALYYLITGDESAVPALVDSVLKAKPTFNCGGGLVSTCQVYDWIYNSPSVTLEQRRKMADHIAKVAYECAKVLESDWAFGLWSHRRAPGWASDVLAAGLVLDDGHPEARRLRAWGMGYFIRNYFRSWQHNGGAWLHGGSSYNIGLIMPRVIACWASAQAEPKVYEVIRRDYGDWLMGHILYLMCETFPNKTRSDAVAWDRNALNVRTPTISALIIARAYRSPDPYAYLRWLGRDPRKDLLNILFYDEDLATAPTRVMEAPMARVFGRRGPGYVQIRSKGWQPDSTVVEFKCGDYIQRDHPNSSLSFWLFHKGRLAVQSGTYGGGEHIVHYYSRSISHNALLVYRPGEVILADDFSPATSDVKTFTHDGRGYRVVDEPGGQRFTGRANTTKVFTFDEYARRKTEPSVTKQLFESGEITAFEHAPDFRYTYISGDGTMAYNNPKFCREIGGRRNDPKVDLVTRSLAWLDGKYLVIFDRVNALNANWRKAWVCHFQGEPKVSGRLIKAEIPGHIEDYDGDIVQATWANGVLKPPDPSDPGRLFIRTFLPKDHYVRRIGGDGYECWSLGGNRMPEEWTGGSYGKYQDIGRWRVEVSPNKPSKFDNFLHLLYPCDTRTFGVPPAEMVTAEGEKMIGVSLGGWLVMFGTKGEVDGPVAYQAPAAKTEHLVVDLKRGAKYRVTGAVGGEKTLTASPEMTLRFATAGPGTVRLTPGQ